MLVMIDNYDSFTYNIVQYLTELGEQVKVVRNDEVSLGQICDFSPDRIVISPGPCTPNEAGISLSVIEHFAGALPILGVCLGHQCIAQAFGGRVVHAKQVMHGKVSKIYHEGAGVFSGIASPFSATRYHSLVVDYGSCSSELELTAWTKDEGGVLEEVMGLRHRVFDIEGVQFHPESILSEHGHQLLRNFLSR